MADKKLESLYQESDELTPRDGLKQDILARAQQEISLKKNRESARVNERRRAPKSSFRRWIAVVACFLFVCLLGGGFWGVYQQDYHTVYIDVNPSVALEVNLFGRVNGVEYVNEDASEALSGIKLKGKSVEDALEKVINAYAEAGYFEEEAELFISAISKNSKKTDKLLKKLAKRAEKVKGDKKYNVNTAKLTKEEKESAKEQGISAGKYKLIKEIMAADSTYTVDDLKDKAMKELKDILKKIEKGNKK
ncbi:MAG: hypothetical protein IJV83_04260 [Clostridia bacterium]|nr:hypothetical protein [Clostridia bacterium]